MSINVIVLSGRLSKDPELRYTADKKPIATFNLCVQKSFSKEGKADFFDCVMWGKQGEALCKYCKKGSTINLRGSLVQRSWKANDGSMRYRVQVQADEIQFVNVSKKTKEEDFPDVDAEYLPENGFGEIMDTSDGEFPF